MTNRETIRDLLTRLFAEQRLAVLATENRGQPHTSLMSFAVDEDLKSFVLTTRCDTKKHENLLGNARVSLLVDNRTDGVGNPQDALAVTVTGKAELTAASEREKARDCFLSIHPELISLTKESDCAIWRIRVVSYQIVKGFETLELWRLAEDESEAFINEPRKNNGNPRGR